METRTICVVHGVGDMNKRACSELGGVQRLNNGDEDGDSGSRTSSIRHNGRTKYPVVEMEKNG